MMWIYTIFEKKISLEALWIHPQLKIQGLRMGYIVYLTLTISRGRLGSRGRDSNFDSLILFAGRASKTELSSCYISPFILKITSDPSINYYFYSFSVTFNWSSKEKIPALLPASHRWNENPWICVKEKQKKLLLSYSDKFLLDPRKSKKTNWWTINVKMIINYSATFIITT